MHTKPLCPFYFLFQTIIQNFPPHFVFSHHYIITVCQHQIESHTFYIVCAASVSTVVSLWVKPTYCCDLLAASIVCNLTLMACISWHSSWSLLCPFQIVLSQENSQIMSLSQEISCIVLSLPESLLNRLCVMYQQFLNLQNLLVQYPSHYAIMVVGVFLQVL